MHMNIDSILPPFNSEGFLIQSEQLSNCGRWGHILSSIRVRTPQKITHKLNKRPIDRYPLRQGMLHNYNRGKQQLYLRNSLILLKFKDRKINNFLQKIKERKDKYFNKTSN